MNYDFSWDQDVVAQLWYTRDWSQWLATGETISASTWTISPSAGTGLLVVVTSAFTGTTASVKLSSGTVDVEYFVTNSIVTTKASAEYQRDPKTFRIRVRQT